MNDISISADNQLIHGGDVYRNKVRLDFSVSLDPLDMPEEIKTAMLAGVSEAGRYPDPLQQKLRIRIGNNIIIINDNAGNNQEGVSNQQNNIVNDEKLVINKQDSSDNIRT